MAKKSASAPAEAAADRAYPNLETLLETQDRDAAKRLFLGTKGKLDEIAKGAKAGQAKKALAGIEKAEALLNDLYDVRDRLTESAGAKKGRR